MIFDSLVPTKKHLWIKKATLIALLVSNFPILQSAYSQENAASTTTDSGPSLLLGLKKSLAV